MLHVLGGPCTNTILRYQASEETKFGLHSFKILGHLSNRLFFIFTWTNISPGIPVLHVQVLYNWDITLTSIVYHHIDIHCVSSSFIILVHSNAEDEKWDYLIKPFCSYHANIYQPYFNMTMLKFKQLFTLFGENT